MTINSDSIAVPCRKAAQLVGISRTQFYKRFVWTNLVQTYDLGGRGRSVKVDELRAAVEKLAADQRNAPQV